MKLIRNKVSIASGAGIEIEARFVFHTNLKETGKFFFSFSRTCPIHDILFQTFQCNTYVLVARNLCGFALEVVAKHQTRTEISIEKYTSVISHVTINMTYMATCDFERLEVMYKGMLYWSFAEKSCVKQSMMFECEVLFPKIHLGVNRLAVSGEVKWTNGCFTQK